MDAKIYAVIDTNVLVSALFSNRLSDTWENAGKRVSREDSRGPTREPPTKNEENRYLTKLLVVKLKY